MTRRMQRAETPHTQAATDSAIPMSLSTAIVLARPERRRILRELLAVEDTWTPEQRLLYADMVYAEYRDVSATSADDAVLAHAQQEDFKSRLLGGEDAETAMAHCRQLQIPDLELPWNESRGRIARERRRALRKAVTALDARAVVTVGGPVSECLVCGKPLPAFFSRFRRYREDRVYCGAACKMRAARMRKRRAHGR